MKSEKIILGIDPGTQISGWGVVAVKGGTCSYISMGIIDLRKEKDLFTRIGILFKEVLGLIDKYAPDELAMEAPFYGKNVQSMLKLGRAQGALISAARSRDIPVFEYAPRKIKLSITGRGAASKEQVATIISKILYIKEAPSTFLDATDGLAAALCHYLSSNASFYVNGRSPKSSVTNGGWGKFIKDNPERVK